VEETALLVQGTVMQHQEQEPAAVVVQEKHRVRHLVAMAVMV
jgi:hypothetical protein